MSIDLAGSFLVRQTVNCNFVINQPYSCTQFSAKVQTFFLFHISFWHRFCDLTIGDLQWPLTSAKTSEFFYLIWGIHILSIGSIIVCLLEISCLFSFEFELCWPPMIPLSATSNKMIPSTKYWKHTHVRHRIYWGLSTLGFVFIRFQHFEQ